MRGPLSLSPILKLQDRPPRVLGFAICLWLAIGIPCRQSLLAQEASGEFDGSDEALRHFEQEIRPLLISNCISCHGASKQEGGLRLDSHEAFLAGGESGSLVGEAGNTGGNLLLEALRYESFEMPPTGPLPERSVAQFEKWLKAGAPWPEETKLRGESGAITAEDRQWWAFQPFAGAVPPALPDSLGNRFVHNPIDRFVVAKLHQNEMRPADQASKEVLLRRLYFDLLGMPPSPNEVQEFVADDAADAWERLVQQLLDDPRYGEHWARFWLDLVRYAESDGWNQDAYRPHIWRYRDYVVNAFNEDKPYSQFVREQLAGDEIGEDNPDHWIATGFLRLGIYEYNQRDARGHWNDIMNEMTDVAGDVFLGLSMACARCHDHKFDPIPQQDYFKLRSFFEPISWRDDLVAATREQKQVYESELAEYREVTRKVQTEIDALIEPYHRKKWISTVDKFPLDIQACFHMPVEQRTSWQNQMAYLVFRQFEEEGGGPLKSMSKEDKAKHAELLKQLEEFSKFKPKPLPAMMAATDFDGLSSTTSVPEDASRKAVEPGYLEVMAELESGDVQSLLHLERHSTGRRTALAEWIGDPKNPLTNRVIVNRIWQQHFGSGLVATPSDLGTQGQLPTHPELLDWLTQQFVDSGGSFKELHKLILTSATWQQSAKHSKAESYQQKDPAELLLWRNPVRRLRAEQIRDAMLAASGEMRSAMGGPSVTEASPRRALYVKSFRNQNENFLHGFDMVGGLQSVAVRDRTTTANQALLMFNGDYALGRAKAMAKRVLKESNSSLAAIEMCFWLAWNRAPTPQELAGATRYLRLSAGEELQDPLAEEDLADFCHVLFNSSQFLYLE